MNIKDARTFHPSPYVSATDLTDDKGKFMTVDVAIRSVASVAMYSQEKGAEEEKAVLHFEGAHKGMVLNKTNNKKLIELFGWQTDDWVGKVIRIKPDRIKAFGKMVETIKILGEGKKKSKEDVAVKELPKDLGKKK